MIKKYHIPLEIKGLFIDFFSDEDRRQKWDKQYTIINGPWTQLMEECWYTKKSPGHFRARLYAKPATNIVDKFLNYY